MGRRETNLTASDEPRRNTPPPIHLVFASHVMLLLAIGCLLYFLVPIFAKTIQESGTRPIAATVFILRLSRLTVRYWYVGLLLVAAYYLLLLGIWKINQRFRGMATFWTVLIWYAGAGFLIWATYNLSITFASIIEAAERLR